MKTEKTQHKKLPAFEYLLLAGTTIIILGFSLFARVAQPQDPFAGAAVTDPPFTPLTYSIQTFLWWDDNYAGQQLDQVHRVLNYSHIKQTFAWRDMETERGVWDFSHADRIVEMAAARDIQIIARLGQVPDWAAIYAGDAPTRDDENQDAIPQDLADWAHYCSTLAERYRGRIAAYQIWNEPNLAREWGYFPPDAAQYVRLLAACSAAIRAADPAAIIISAGLAPTGRYDDLAHPDDVYLDAMYRAGFQQHTDVVGVHAPGYGQAPTYGPDDAAADGLHRSSAFRRVEDLRKIMLQHDDAARQMAILEFGWTTDTINPDYAWHAVDEATQAQYIVDAYAYAAAHWRPWVGLMSLIYLPAQNWTPQDEEYWWAIVEPTGRVKPAFFAIASMQRYCGERVIDGWLPDMSEEEYLEQRDTCT